MSVDMLEHFLEPFTQILRQEGVEEIMVNRPGELFVESAGQGIKQISNPVLTLEYLEGLVKLIANNSGQSLDHVNTLLSGNLPGGERIQIVLPPSCEAGKICFSIRKPSTTDHTLDTLKELGLFDGIQENGAGVSQSDRDIEQELREGDYSGFIKSVVLNSKNIVISGGTSSGKTTLVNAMLKYISETQRIITIEDTREVVITQPNRVHLLASKGGQSTAKAGTAELFAACLRLRPDRIMLAEVRGPEAYDWLNAASSGHPGSITTVHSNNIRTAVDRLARYVGEHPAGRNIPDIQKYVRQSVDVFIHVEKNRATGKRGITEIEFNLED